jgi:hypothetical protein
VHFSDDESSGVLLRCAEVINSLTTASWFAMQAFELTYLRIRIVLCARRNKLTQFAHPQIHANVSKFTVCILFFYFYMFVCSLRA